MRVLRVYSSHVHITGTHSNSQLRDLLVDQLSRLRQLDVRLAAYNVLLSYPDWYVSLYTALARSRRAGPDRVGSGVASIADWAAICASNWTYSKLQLYPTCRFSLQSHAVFKLMVIVQLSFVKQRHSKLNSE